MKNRFMFLLLTITLLFTVGIYNIAAEDNVIIGTVIATTLNIRSTADVNGEVLAEVSQGSKLVLIERIGDWYKVNLGFDGYVYANYVATDEEVANSPQQQVNTSQGQQVVDFAKTLLGIPYKYGGTTTKGFDCSGFVQYVYKNMGVSLNRVAADQVVHGIAVSKENLQPGDLVFFKKSGRAIHHVGIYVGDGKYIHAPQTGRNISIDVLNRSDYYTARRIFY